MNTSEEIQEAFQDYHETKFGGWPWKENGVVFPRDKGRFASIEGVERVFQLDDVIVPVIRMHLAKFQSINEGLCISLSSAINFISIQ